MLRWFGRLTTAGIEGRKTVRPPGLAVTPKTAPDHRCCVISQPVTVTFPPREFHPQLQASLHLGCHPRDRSTRTVL